MEYFKWCKFLFEIITGKTGIATFLKTDSYIFFSYQLGEVLHTKFYRVINSYVFRWLNNRELLTRQKTFELLTEKMISWYLPPLFNSGFSCLVLHKHPEEWLSYKFWKSLENNYDGDCVWYSDRMMASNFIRGWLNYHCVKSGQTRSYFWSLFSHNWSYNSVVGHFSRIVQVIFWKLSKNI